MSHVLAFDLISVSDGVTWQQARACLRLPLGILCETRRVPPGDSLVHLFMQVYTYSWTPSIYMIEKKK